MNRFKILILAAAAAIPAAGFFFASAAGPNLVTNGDFTNGVAGWDNFSGNPQPQNGAMAVTNNYQGTGNSYYSGWYCVGGIQPGTQYTVNTQAFVDPASPANTGAAIGLHYYASTDCSGGNLVTGGGLQYGGFAPNQRGQWITLGFNETAPAGAKSVRVRATAVKHPNPSNTSIPGSHVVLFDNVYFGEADLATPTPSNTPVPTSTPKPSVTPVASSTPAADPTPSIPTPNIPNPGGIDTPIEYWPTATPTSKPADKPGSGGGATPGSTPSTNTQTNEPETPSQEPGTVQPQTSANDNAPLPPATGTGAPSDETQTDLLLLAGASTIFLGLVGGAFATRRRR